MSGEIKTWRIKAYMYQNSNKCSTSGTFERVVTGTFEEARMFSAKAEKLCKRKGIELALAITEEKENAKS